MNSGWKALALSLVPGLGHLYLGRHWRGMLVFLLFALGVNGVYFSTTLDAHAFRMPMYYLCRGAAMAAWLYSVLHVAHLSHRFEPRARRERRDYHFKRGLSSYLAGAYDQAAEEFHAVLKLDPLDADARFHLGMTLLARGETRAARKTFRRCLADDVSGKWRWEIETRLESIGKPS